MVGKGADNKGSRIFQQCYLKCCKLQNLTPLNCVVPSGNGKILDFCVDRIKYGDWAPILNALSFDLSLHSVAIRCRQQVKTVLEQIDCERLAKTVNKRAVILTNFMLSNLMEALAQLLSNTTLLLSLLLEGLPLKIPYLNPLTEALLSNNSLQHLSLPRCLIGDAGCLALCKAVRCLPNILSLDLSGCELTVLGASYIAELIKYQKIHRYSENWVHTLRYRLPELDAMAGLRRLTLCANPGLGDGGVGKLLEVLADDLWIRALDVQNCNLSDATAQAALQILQSNNKLIVLDMRYNPEISSDSMSVVRAALRRNETELSPGQGQYSWLGSSSSQERLARHATKNGVVRDKSANTRNGAVKYAKSLPVVKKDKEFSEELLTTQLAEELQHRRQLEELNLQLVQQMQSLRREQMRLWDQRTTSSGSEQSCGTSAASCDLSPLSSGSSRSVPIDQHTLGYIQQAFQDIYAFIKHHQCTGECQQTTPKHQDRPQEVQQQSGDQVQYSTTEITECRDLRVSILPKKAPSAHAQIVENMKMQKITKSAHLIGNSAATRGMDMKPEMFERQMGDTTNCHMDEQTILEAKKLSSRSLDRISASSSVASGSSTPRGEGHAPRGDGHAHRGEGHAPRSLVAPGQVLYSSSDDDDDDDIEDTS